MKKIIPILFIFVLMPVVQAGTNFNAIIKEWPRAPENTTKKFTIGIFVLNLPGDWKKITVLPEQHIRIDYGKNRSIGLAWQSVENIGISRDELKKSGYYFSDVPDLIFTKSTSDPLPIDTNKAKVIKAILAVKRNNYPGVSSATIFRKGQLSAHSARIKLTGYTSSTIISYKKYRSHTLKILGSGINQETIVGIIGSVKPKKGF